MSQKRNLTPGEIALAVSIYRNAIDLSAVEIRRHKWWPFQSRNVAMAPMGHLHFHPDGPLWREDFSEASVSLRGLLIHELCHVWQTQRGIFLPLRRLPFARYSYTLRLGKPFTSYGMEQQAEIAANTYLAREGHLALTAADRAQHEALIAQIR
ncbi:MAG TPA: vgr related protein [Sphingomonas sp.]|uniref:vgr related protein n=1 Tax=Sphingomonas sp. TaxID=28214 RepID=UPI002C3330B7|nr:vgr related protein [Sphingomonas sp.]HMI20753.1 vgr related protein [Sphingomonas sp.]